MSKNTGTLALQQFLPYRLSALTNRISQSLATKYSERFDINVHEWRVIAVLGEESSLSSVSITNRVAMDKVAVSRAVKRLIDKNLVVKKLDDKDQRRHELALTPNGIDLYQQLIPIALAHEKSMTDNLSEQDKADLLRLLSKLDNVEF